METEAEAVIAAAVAAADPKIVEPGTVYSVTVPDGTQHQIVDLEKYLPVPSRKKGSAAFTEGGSLARYVKDHDAGDGSAMLYADPDALTVVAVLNGHRGDSAGWGDHRATLTLRHTPEWKHWLALNGQLVDQVKFAEHLEDGLAEIVEPPGAEMLELAQTFQANTKVAFKSFRQLDNGQRQVSYEETIDAKAGTKGNITIPPRFQLGLAPFDGAEPYRLDARLRFRIREGDLRIGYVLDRPDVVMRAAFDDVLTSLETATGLVAFHGRPS
jgi:uncharacterized protein YfdQ (DUF2303 family)